MNSLDFSIICQLPTPEISIQFSAATAIYSHLPLRSSTLGCQFSKSKSKSKLCYSRRSGGQSVLVSSTHLGLKTRFFLRDSYGFVDVGRPLWRQGGSVFYNVLCTIYLYFTCYYMNVYTPYIYNPLPILRVRVTLRLAVYRQSVRLGDKPLQTHDQ
jgi:hypothetical protein